MAKGVVYVPVTLPPVADKRRMQTALEDTVRECRHYVLVIAETWGPEERNFREDYLLALQLLADSSAEMQTVTVLAKGGAAQEMPEPDAVYSTPEEFEEKLTGLMRSWLEAMPEPVEEIAAEAVLVAEVVDVETTPAPQVSASVMPLPEKLPDAPPSEAEPEICFACGFCCDGTLFPNIAVLPEDSPELLVKIGFAPLTGPEGKAIGFTQPCSQFNGKCAAYEVGRPVACATYRCRLLRTVAAGRYDKDEALKIVSEAKALKESASVGKETMLRAADPGYVGVTAISDAACVGRLMNAPERNPFQDEYGPAAARVMKFVDYLNANFLAGS